MLEQIAERLLPVWDPPPRKIPIRVKNFYSCLFILIGFAASFVPLYGSTRLPGESGVVTFFRRGTMMHVGMQPYALADMFCPFLFRKNTVEKTRTVSFLLSLVWSAHWTWMNDQAWICFFQLVCMSYAIVYVLGFLDVWGSVSLSAGLIFFHSCDGIFFRFSTLYVLPFGYLVAWLDRLKITIPLTRIGRKSGPASIELPVMYYGTSPLLMYTTMFEALPLPRMWFPLRALMLYAGVYLIATRVNQARGIDLIRGWRKQKYTIKGWHSEQRMAKYVQSIIDRNVYWNVVFLCVLWTCSAVLNPSISPMTFFVLTSVANRYTSG